MVSGIKDDTNNLISRNQFNFGEIKILKVRENCENEFSLVLWLNVFGLKQIK